MRQKLQQYKIEFVSFFSQQWLLDPSDLIRERQVDFAVLTEDEYQKLFIFFTNCKLSTFSCIYTYDICIT